MTLRDPRWRVALALALVFGGAAATEAVSTTLGLALVLAGLAVIYLTGVAPGGSAWQKRKAGGDSEQDAHADS